MLTKRQVEQILKIIEMQKTMTKEEIIAALFPPSPSVADLYMGR